MRKLEYDVTESNATAANEKELKLTPIKTLVAAYKYPSTVLDQKLNLSEDNGFSTLGGLKLSRILSAQNDFINKAATAATMVASANLSKQSETVVAAQRDYAAANLSNDAQVTQQKSDALRDSEAAFTKTRTEIANLQSVQNIGQRAEAIVKKLDQSGALTNHHAYLILKAADYPLNHAGTQPADQDHEHGADVSLKEKYATPVATVVAVLAALHETVEMVAHQAPRTRLGTDVNQKLKAWRSAGEDSAHELRLLRSIGPLLQSPEGSAPVAENSKPSNLVVLSHRPSNNAHAMAAPSTGTGN